MPAPTPQTIRPFKHVKQPANDESLRQWLEIELTNIQNTLTDLLAAIRQLQTFTGV